MRFPRQTEEIVQGMLDSLVLEGVLCHAGEGLYFHREAVDDLQERIVRHLQEHGETDIQGFKTLAGITRKFLVPILEYFDADGVTKRLENGNRVLCDSSPKRAEVKARAGAIPLH